MYDACRFVFVGFLVCVFALAASKTDQELFETFVKTHGRTYTPDEYPKRFAIFASNLKRIRASKSGLNKKTSNLNQQELGLNSLADKSPEEFKRVKSSHPDLTVRFR